VFLDATVLHVNGDEHHADDEKHSARRCGPTYASCVMTLELLQIDDERRDSG
jgi:hypothetical protein